MAEAEVVAAEHLAAAQLLQRRRGRGCCRRHRSISPVRWPVGMGAVSGATGVERREIDAQQDEGERDLLPGLGWNL